MNPFIPSTATGFHFLQREWAKSAMDKMFWAYSFVQSTRNCQRESPNNTAKHCSGVRQERGTCGPRYSVYGRAVGAVSVPIKKIIIVASIL